MMTAAIAALILSCGAERWDVKVLQDAAAARIHLDSFSGTTVTNLRGLTAQAWGDHAPRGAAEMIVHEVPVLLIGAKLEDDEDIHIVVADPRDVSKTMVVEAPSAHCTEGTDAHARAEMAAARKKFLTLMRVSAKYKTFAKPIPATIRGVTFFDKHVPGHIPTGSAPNGVELHPVTSLELIR